MIASDAPKGVELRGKRDLLGIREIHPPGLPPFFLEEQCFHGSLIIRSDCTSD